MAETKNWTKIKITLKVTFIILAKGHNLPGNWARELFKPSEDGQSLVV